MQNPVNFVLPKVYVVRYVHVHLDSAGGIDEGALDVSEVSHEDEPGCATVYSVCEKIDSHLLDRLTLSEFDRHQLERLVKLCCSQSNALVYSLTEGEAIALEEFSDNVVIGLGAGKSFMYKKEYERIERSLEQKVLRRHAIYVRKD